MFKKEKIKTLQVLSALIAISALIASIIGVAFPTIYKPIVLDKAIPLVFAQDLITIAAAVLLLIITFLGKKENIKLNIIQTAIIGYMFYAYGQYVLGDLYNYFYFLYQAIFSLSIFYFINAFSGIEYERLEFSMPKSLRLIITVFCAVGAAVFAPQWVILILKWVHNGLRPNEGNFIFLVAVVILDLCFLIPVSVTTSIFLFQKKILGVILSGILLLKIFILFISIVLGYLVQPIFHNMKMNVVGAILYSGIAFACLVLSIFYFIHTKVIKTDAESL
jgi:hypothetical protein